MIHQLFIDEESEMQRCQAACVKRRSVVVSGIDARDGRFCVRRGFVKNVEDFPGDDQGSPERWRVTVQS